MLEEILASVISRLALAWPLPIARWLATTWANLYTLLVPAKQSRERRDLILSDLHEHVASYSEKGDHSAAIALQIFIRMLSGLGGDVAWAAPHWRKNLPEKLDTWSDTIQGGYKNEAVMASLAFFALINLAAFTSDAPSKLTEFLMTNGAGVIAIGFAAISHRRWIQRALSLVLTCLIVGAIAICTWLVIEYRLYEIPSIREYLQHLAIFVPPIVLAFAINTRFCRTYIFRHRRWPVFAGWALIAAVIIGAFLALGVSIATIATIVGVCVIGVVMFLATCVFLLIVAALFWKAVLFTSSVGLRQLAKSLRRSH